MDVPHGHGVHLPPSLEKQFQSFYESCLPGESFLVPDEWRESMHELKSLADTRVRQRNSRLRVWLQSDPLRFECKFWVFDTEPPTPKQMKWRWQRDKYPKKNR